MVLNAYARPTTDRVVIPLGRGLVRLGATPNALTMFGLLATFVGAGIVVADYHLAGALVLAFATATDALEPEFSVPDREGWETNQEIAALYEGTGGDTAPLLPVVTLPEGESVDSPAVRADLERIEATESVYR